MKSKDWIEKLVEREGIETNWVKCHAVIAVVTSIPEAIYIQYLVYMWRAKKDGEYVYNRHLDYGMYIHPSRFRRKTGLSIDQFKRLTRKYEKLKILNTTVIKSEANTKYYNVDLKRLRRYLCKKLIKPNKDIKRVVDSFVP